MIHYLWWIPALLVMYSLYAYVCYMNNTTLNPKWFALSWVVGVIPLWVIVSRFSKNLFFDAFLFDILMLTTYAIVTGILTRGFIKFSWYNWVGFCLIVGGFVLLKLKV